MAALIAEGLTNREIATRLVVSKRTVDAHVEHILSKLGFSSRVQVVTLARPAPRSDGEPAADDGQATTREAGRREP